MLYVIIHSLCKAKGYSFDENVSTPHRSLRYAPEHIFFAVLSTLPYYSPLLLNDGVI